MKRTALKFKFIDNLQPGEIYLNRLYPKLINLFIAHNMLTFPNAKINIGLFVTNKRNDGYHDLETIFYPVALKDALEFIATDKQETAIELSGLPVAGDAEKNLVWKALQLLKNDFPEQIKPIAIYLHKVIPMGAGMGGGSADGSFMLKMLNENFDLGLNDQALMDYALRLGSDCPFFILNKPCFAKGRGEQLEPLPGLDLKGYDIQLICPQIHISTATAFSGIRPAAAAFDLTQIAHLPITAWKEHIKNDFELPVFQEHPVLADIKEQLYRQGAQYAAMSGTGSTIYGIFEKGKKAAIHCSVPFSEHISTH